ncbi:MAG: hypothetical protein G01um101466_550, partial [Parcubacteria group bacterium Gr01-1014_66]
LMIEKSLVRKIGIGIGALTIFTLIFFAGVWFGYEQRPAVERVRNVLNQQSPPQFAETDLNLFWKVWSLVEEKYVDKKNIDRSGLVIGAISGLVRALDDPYTEFLPPKETQQFREDIKGSFEGIGAEIALRKGILTIVAPLKNSPAERAGLRAGDKILQIDNTTTRDLPLDEAVRLIRGEKGTKVRLTILRDGFDAPKQFEVIRDTIRVNIVETARRENGIFVIMLHHFTESAPLEFRKAVREFYESDSKKLILDLRNNPGGFLGVAVDIASWFLPEGATVAEERFADGTKETYNSQGYGLLERVPVVVLINQGSASASEIVAGALRDGKGITLVGQKTFGKGSVQEVINLERNSSLKITIAKWVTPKGTEINGKGLEPDIHVEIPEARPDEDTDHDPVMEKAIEILKNE